MGKIDAIRKSHSGVAYEQSQETDNLGLSSERFLPQIEEQGGHDLKDRALVKISGFKFGGNLRECYTYAFRQWKNAIEREKNTLSFSMVACSKIMLGSGNASSLEIGLNLNKPWGVPYISGSSIKGVVASYLRRTDTMGAQSADYINIFGGTFDGKKYSGSVIFNDAWLYPDGRSWFVRDIINPHYSQYYSGHRMPDGMESPVPIQTLALDSGLSFLVSMQGPKEILEYLKNAMAKAVEEYGIGAKTSVGYGRFKVVVSDEERQKLAQDIRRPHEVSAYKLTEDTISNSSVKSGGSKFQTVQKVTKYNYDTEAMIVGKTKKGGWKVKVDGIVAPIAILNSDSVPAECKEGDYIKVFVKSAVAADYKP